MQVLLHIFEKKHLPITLALTDSNARLFYPILSTGKILQNTDSDEGLTGKLIKTLWDEGTQVDDDAGNSYENL